MLKSRSIVIGLLSGLTLMGASTIANFDSRTLAQQPSQTQGTQNYPKSTGKVNSGDRTFLTRSAQDSLLEVATSQLAIQRATNPQIVQYSLRIMSDHTQYNQRLMLLSREKGLSLPVELDSQGRNKLAKLTRLQGAAFDREYTREIQKSNTDDVKQLQRQLKATQDQSVKSFVTEALPTQQQHQQLASVLGGK